MKQIASDIYNGFSVDTQAIPNIIFVIWFPIFRAFFSIPLIIIILNPAIKLLETLLQLSTIYAVPETSHIRIQKRVDLL